MKRTLVLGPLLLAALGCGIRGAPRPAQPEAPPQLPPTGTTGPVTQPTQRGPFNPSAPPDAGTSSPDAGAPAATADAGTPSQP